jgi:hypothetical protein
MLAMMNGWRFFGMRKPDGSSLSCMTRQGHKHDEQDRAVNVGTRYAERYCVGSSPIIDVGLADKQHMRASVVARLEHGAQGRDNAGPCTATTDT